MRIRGFVWTAVAVGFVAAGAGSARADDQSHSVQVPLDSAVMLAGQTLPAGEYTFSWMGSGPQVDVAIKRGGKVIEEAKARLVEESARSEQESILTRRQTSGASVLEEVRLGGERTALVFKSA